MSRSMRQTIAALRLVSRRRVRSALASTGVAVAVGTLIIAVCTAERSRQATIEEIRRMGADVLVVDAATSRNVGGRARTGRTVTTLTENDAREISLRVAGVAQVAAEYRGTLPMKVGDLARQVTVSGMGATYGDLRSAPVARGRFYSSTEEVAGLRVVVLGSRLADDLFEGADPLGARIRLGGVPFDVVGILPERGTGVDAFDEDQVAFVPLRTARRRLFNVEHVQRIFVRAGRGVALDDLDRAVTALVASRHPRRAGDSLDFRVQDQRRLVEMRQGAADRLRTFQLSLASMMLLAGGGGMFALQLLAVRERRPEIGVRRALGATRWEIFSHFVTEAVAITAVGTIAGLAIGWLGGLFTGIAVPGDLAIFTAFATLGVCSLGAAIPAQRASRLPPAQALRLR
jgi:putative ABC transport system permease protein